MKNSKELKELRSDIITQLECIQDVATIEERDLTKDENKNVDGFLTEVDELDTKIVRAEKMEKSLRDNAKVSGIVVESKIDKDISKFTFQEAMRQAYTGNLSGIVKEMDQEARSEARYTGQNFKGLAIPSSILQRAAVGTSAVNATSTMSFTDQLEANLVLAQAGANFYSGVDNMKFPVISAVNSYFVPEAGGSAGAANGTAGSITLTPKKIISVVNVSNEALIQNASLEAALQRNMAASIAATFENALLDTADITNAPLSIFADAAVISTGNTAADYLALETALLAAGVMLGDNVKYLIDSDAYATVKSLAQVSSVSAIWDNANRELNGYKAFASSGVAASGVTGKAHALCGDFSKVHIAQFGGLDILFDPFTGGATGEPRMIVTSLMDGDAAQNGAAFATLIEA
tara:strand:- start:12498 stop:13715 length:1218 start_codon:yes stop_codon:yes gene_type:complete